jgi:hypothetical protein
MLYIDHDHIPLEQRGFLIFLFRRLQPHLSWRLYLHQLWQYLCPVPLVIEPIFLLVWSRPIEQQADLFEGGPGIQINIDLFLLKSGHFYLII